MSSSEGESDHEDSEEENYEDEDQFYDEDDGDLLHAFGGLYQYEDEYYEQDEHPDEFVSTVPKGFPPKLSSYVNVNTSEHPNLGFNRGKDDAWSQIKQEVEFVRERYGVKGKATQKLFSDVFGEESKLFDAWKVTTSNKSLSDFSTFLATFFLECRLKTTYQDIHDDKIVDTSNYLAPEKYRGWWRKIDEYNKSDKFKERAWESFEHAFNVLAKEILLPSKGEFVMHMTCDDDKHHFEFGIKPRDVPIEENSYLKRERHVKDNASGMVADVCIYTGSGFPINVHYRRKGESEVDSVKAAFKFLFNFGGDGPNSLPNLSGKVKFAADRGYWRIALLAYVLSLGVDVLGTIMRQLWFPFDSGRNKNESTGGREHISADGPPCMFQKSVSHNFGKQNSQDFNLTATAFRNGYSSTVVMALASDHSYALARELDAVIETAESARRYFNDDRRTSSDRFMNAFKYLIGSYGAEGDYDVAQIKRVHARSLKEWVRPLTEGQGDRAWHIMRQNSCTSSVMDKVISAKAPFIDVDDTLRVSYELVLKYAGMLEKLPKPRDINSSNASSNGSADADEDVNSSEHGDPNADADERSITDSVVLDFLHPDAEHNTFNENEETVSGDSNSSSGSSESSHITSWQAYLSNNNGVIGTPAEFVDTFTYHNHSNEFEKMRKQDANEFLPTVDDSFISECLSYIKRAPLTGSSDTLRQLLLDWTQCGRSKRRVMFMNKPDMKELVESYEEEGHCISGRIKWYKSNAMIRTSLAKILDEINYGIVDDDVDATDGGIEPENKYLAEFLASSYMKRLPKGDDEGFSKYTAHGQRMESSLLRKFYHISLQDGVLASNASIDAIYRPGLVYSTTRNENNFKRYYLRTSADGVAIEAWDIDDEDEATLWVVPIECKSRCVPRTYHREIKRIVNAWAGGFKRAGFKRIDGWRNEVLIAELDAFVDHRADDDDSDDGAHSNDELEVNPVLHRVIPDPHELMQLLHHAATYSSPKVYFLVGSDYDLLAVYLIRFPFELIDSYKQICDGFYENDLKVFYQPGDEVPELPDKWINAFQSPKLKYLNMDSSSWNYAISIWRLLNIDINASTSKPQRRFLLPLPALARIVPLVISTWNALKGGGDTITKLLDRCKEQVGIRSECVMASARLLLYFAVLFHRINQWSHAKVDLDFYPSAEHARDANNKRASFYKSLTLLCEMLISQARRATLVGGGEAAFDELTVHYTTSYLLYQNAMRMKIQMPMVKERLVPAADQIVFQVRFN